MGSVGNLATSSASTDNTTGNSIKERIDRDVKIPTNLWIK